MIPKEEKRAISDAEVLVLKGWINKYPTKLNKVSQGAENAVVMFAVSVFVLLLLWFVVAKISMWLWGADIGSKSEDSLAGWFAIVLVSVVYAIYSSIQWVRSWPDDLENLKKDLENGQVFDTVFKVREVKLFVEPEHDGHMFMLRMENGAVYPLYDHGCVEDAVDPDVDDIQYIQPRKNIRIISAPLSGYLFSQDFSGEIISVPPALELSAPVSLWPEGDVWCETPWEELEKRLCA